MQYPSVIKTLFRSLRHRNFRLFWSGQLISLVGTWMQNVGQAWLVLELTRSSFKLGVVSALQLTGVVQYWHVLVLATILGVANTVDMPARQAFIIEMVGKEDLMNAIALNSSIFNAARAVGPAVAGLLIGALGTGACFFVNGLSYLAVIWGLWLISFDEPRTTRQGAYHIIADIREAM